MARAWVKCAVVAASALAALTGSAARADDVDDRVAALRECAKAGDDAGAAKAATALLRRRDRRADEALLAVARDPGLSAAAREAMRVLGVHGDPSYLTWVRSRLPDGKFLEAEPERFHAMLDSLPAAGAALKPVLRALADFVSDTMKSKPDSARRAVVAYTSAGGEKAVVDQLVEWLEKLDAPSGGSGGGRRGGLTSPPPLAGTSGGGGGAASTQGVKDAILGALADLTGGTETSSHGWSLWWSAHRAEFRPSPPRKPGIDWANVREFTDDTYDFLLKKPGGDAAWTYSALETTGGRVRLTLVLGGVTAARIDVSTAPKGEPAAVARRLGEGWRKSDFTDFFKDGEPAVVAKGVGGREAAYVAARGAAAGDWKDWDALERRGYVVPAGDVVLVFDAAVRANLDEAKRQSVWAAVEGITFVAE